MSKRHRIPTTLAIALTLLAGASVVAHAEVSGTFTVDGKPIPITQAYAYATKGFFDPKLQDVVVVLCDAVVPPDATRDASARRQLSKTGKLHCVEQTINTKKEVINFTVHHEKFKMPEGGGSTFQVFEAKTFDSKTIAGRSRTTAPQKSFDDVPYSYDITFSLPIAPLK
jgi:hypothetical protein